MPEMVQINLRAGAAQKARWEQYLEESNRFASLSELIRASVEAEIAEDAPTETSSPPQPSQDFDEVKANLETLQEDVAWLREHFQVDTSLSTFAQTVFDELKPLPDFGTTVELTPDDDRSPEQIRRESQASAVVDPGSQPGRNPQTIAALADRLDEPPDRVEDAIGYLQDQWLPVVEVELDGATHYFRED